MMFETLFWGAVLRLLQSLFQAAPTICVGVLVAGVLQRLLGYAGTRRLFAQGTWRSLLQAWLIGMLLPVCSLGVIPIARQLRRAGVSGGAILAFALTAPLFNPISVLYGLTLANPVVIVTFCLGSLVIVGIVGLAWDRLFPDAVSQTSEPPAVVYGVKRILAVGVTAARELSGPSLGYIGVGLLGVAGLSTLLPPGSLQQAAEHHDPWAPVFMAWIATPAYATPMTAMVQLASMFEHGNSVGAAFALLTLGAGANLGLIAWMIHAYGVRRTLVWFGILWAVVIALAYGVDKPLYPHGVDPPGHTHAFDGYCCPFQAGEPQVLQRMLAILAEKTPPWERQAMFALLVLALAGGSLKWSGRAAALESWLQRPSTKRNRYDLVLPAPFLGGAALAGLIALSVLGCYVYYLPPGEILEELRIVNTEVVAAASSGDWKTAAHWIPIQRDWTRKLQVSMFLRGRHPTRYQRAKAEVLLARLEQLDHEIEDRHREHVRSQARAVLQAYRRLQAAHAEWILE